MVDLRNQYLKIKDEIDTAVFGVLDSTRFIRGPEVGEFENDLANYLKVDHVIGCANGTDALQVALMALNLQPGDEVITTNFSFIATVETIALLGLIPVLVEADPKTFNIDTESIEKAISPNTKAIIPVHLFGQCADMEPILQLAKKHRLAVIEDVAQAIGAEYTFSNGTVKRAGTMGDIGTTSFFPSKNLGCYGDGGALLTNDRALAEAIRSIINHGSKVKYKSERLGVNSRLDTLQAAILGIKLKYLDSYIQARQMAAQYYDGKLKNLDKIVIPVRNDKSTHVFHQYTILTKNVDRSNLREYLSKKGIPTMIYYPLPMHFQEAFAYLGHAKGDFPISEDLCKSVLSLPMHTELDEGQLNYISDCIISFIRS